MGKYKITIYWKKDSIDNVRFKNPWVKQSVDNYQIDRDLRYLYINRVDEKLSDGMFNLDDMLGFDIEKVEEK